jgi:murein DD-endopeptidase MepM/ murein hydrolase activator NlpD
MKRTLLILGLFWSLSTPAPAFEFRLPTDNDAVLRPEDDTVFFQPTAEGSIASGKFGCVRRGGARFHEGVDIKPLRHDRKGESIDPVMAVSDGALVFINAKPGLSNYGRYVILRHTWDGVEVHTLYAHLREIASGLAVGQPVRIGQVIGVMGRSTNTREGIPQERAHLHFEICFMLNTRFDAWYRPRDPKAPEFGNFNGQNFFGIDPVALMRARVADPKLNFAHYMTRQPLAFTVMLPARPFSWLDRHPEQIQKTSNDLVPVAYEVGVTSTGVPIAIWPRSAQEISDASRQELRRGRVVLARVNEVEMAANNCRGYVRRAGKGWELTADGRDWVDLLRYNP